MQGYILDANNRIFFSFIQFWGLYSLGTIVVSVALMRHRYVLIEKEGIATWKYQDYKAGESYGNEELACETQEAITIIGV
jgi:hypothetical protein